MKRDPRQDPRQGDMLSESGGMVHTVLYNRGGVVATGFQTWPYNEKATLALWRSWAKKAFVLYRARDKEDSYSERLARHDPRR